MLPNNRRKSGLSPRVRGKPFFDEWAGVVGGSIPACAGEAGRRLACGVIGWVYPRVCGGSGPAIIFTSPAGGLSPRVRGKPQ